MPTTNLANAGGPAQTKKLSLKEGFDRGMDILVGLAVILQLVIVFSSIIAREVLHTPIMWADEIGQLALTIIAFMGGALAYTRNEHMAVHAFVDRLPAAWRPAINAFVEWLVVVGSAVGAYVSLTVIEVRWNEYTAILNIRFGWFVYPLTLGLAMMVIYALIRLWKLPRLPVIGMGILVAAMLGGMICANTLWGPFGVTTEVYWVLFFAFAIPLALGLPVGFVLVMVSLIFLYLTGRGNPAQIPLVMQSTSVNFVMLAIPFFMMAGYVMTEGGLSKRLADFVIAVVGRVRGGLLQAMVVTMYIFSGLSGSKAADVAAVGSTLNPMLRSNGYAADESAAVLAAATVMGETIPPSLPMLILGSITTISIGSLFMAGLLPAAMIAACLMVAIYIKTRLAGKYPATGGVPFGEICRLTLRAAPALFVPVFLIGGIVSGLATPTEISTFAVVYALVLAAFFYKQLTWRKCWTIMLDTSVKSGMILFITSAGGAFSWALTAAGLPQKIAQLMISVAGKSDWLFMLATIVILIVMGALLEGIPALLVFAPLLVPIVPQFGIDPLQYGIVLLIAMGIGAFSPPMGIGLYITCSVCGTSVDATSRAMLPFLVVLFAGLLLVAFIPWFSLVVPKLMSVH